MDGPAALTPTRRRVSLILPTWNEEAGIRQAIAEADAALAAIAADYEVLVVDDGSTDATAAIVAEEAATRPNVRLIQHQHNRGYGAALRTGFAGARFDLVAFTDADCQFDLADLGRLLDLTDRFPIVAGRRADRQDCLRRRLLSLGYNLLTRTLLGTRVRDCDCALKVFRREVLPDIMPQSNGFFVNAEMLTRARQRGLDVAEIDVRHRPRLRGHSKVRLGDVPRTLRTLLPFWWSGVLFAGPAPGLTAQRRLPITALVVLLLIAGLLFFARLRMPLLEPQESRYAEIPRQMLAEGRLLVPVLHGQPYLDKPPLLYWLVMATYRLCGVHDWAARLVPGLAGIGAVLLSWWWGRRLLGDRAGFLGALVLCLSAEFVYRIRMLTMDGLLCLWVTASLACATEALRQGRLRHWWWLASAFLCGLGVLTKGPVAPVLVVPPLLVWACLDPRCARISRGAWLAFAAVMLAVAGPWYLLVSLREPEFLGYFFWTHNVVRFAAPFDHARPAWYYLPGMLAGMLPWAMLWPELVRFLARHSRRAAARRPAALGLLLLVGLWCLTFFSAAGCKRPGYVLPAMPPLALVLGWYLDLLLPRAGAATASAWAALWARGSRLAYRATLLVFIVALAAGILAGGRGLIRPSTAGVLALAALVGLCVVVPRRRAISWGACAATTFAVLFVALVELHTGYSRYFALRDVLRDAYRHRPQAGPVICYPQRWDSVSFYRPDADVRVFDSRQHRELIEELRSRPRTVVLVKTDKLEHFKRALPASVEFVAQGRAGIVTAGLVKPRAVAPDRQFAAVPSGRQSDSR
jgi:dolichol-phosphate mannosyltransferase